jgi:hypothetical protein
MLSKRPSSVRRHELLSAVAEWASLARPRLLEATEWSEASLLAPFRCADIRVVKDAIACKAEADRLVGFVYDELIADVKDIPPCVLGVSRVHWRRGGAKKNE